MSEIGFAYRIRDFGETKIDDFDFQRARLSIGTRDHDIARLQVAVDQTLGRRPVPKKSRLRAARSRNHRRLTSRARPRILRPTHLIRRARGRPSIRPSRSMIRCRPNKSRWMLLVFPSRLFLNLLSALATVRVARLQLPRPSPPCVELRHVTLPGNAPAIW